MRTKIILLVIISLGAFLRFFNLSTNPPSLNWDEASLGYNAWTLLNYGTDEYGNSWPFSIRSFNDYKPPLYTYLTILPVALFGLTEFATRFISAFLGTATIFIVYLLAKQISLSQKFIHLPILAALLFAIAPWSLQFSRGAFEGNIAVFFTTASMYLLLRWLNAPSSPFQLLFGSTLMATAALYAYHAPRVVIPLLAVSVFLKYYRKFLRHWQHTAICLLVAAILLTPALVVTLRGSTAARASAVSIFNTKYLDTNIREREAALKSENSLISLFYDERLQYLRLFLKGYFDHYSIAPMFIYGDVVDRHHAPDMGQFYFIELPFMLLGLVLLAVKKYQGKFLFWSWWLIAPIPAALASGTPHAIRSILILPLPQIATALGILFAYQYFAQTNFLRKILTPTFSKLTFTAIISLGFFFNFAYYLIQYHIHQPLEKAFYWQYGYKELVSYFKDIYPQYEKAVVTTSFDQPYIFFLFYEKYGLENGVNPGDFNRYYKNITFQPVDYLKLRQNHDIVIVGAYDEIPPGEPIELNKIYFPDGEVAFRIIMRPKLPNSE